MRGRRELWRGGDCDVLLALCAPLCVSAVVNERCVGATVLGQLSACVGAPEQFRDERFSLLAAPLQREMSSGADATVLANVCFVLGHMMDPRGVALALPLRTHPSQDVGRGVVSALLAQKDESAIAALIELTRDGNRDVRDWATFGLVAMIDVDTPPIRDALRARLTDEDGDTRHEALGGLARQKDADAIVMIGDWLMRGEISEPLMQAAAEAANPSLCEGLRRARKVSRSKLRASKSIWKTLAKRR